MTAPSGEATADAIIAALALLPHPEGGHYRETFRDSSLDVSGRACSTAIYYLLRAGEISRWHHVDAVEVWHYYAGAPLLLSMRDGEGAVRDVVLGPDVLRGAHPQVIVPAGVWQKARSQGAYTLVGCTVAPGFTFDGFELAPPDWDFPG